MAQEASLPQPPPPRHQPDVGVQSPRPLRAGETIPGADLVVPVGEAMERLAGRRERDAYHARWEQGRAALEREAARWEAHRSAANRWRAAVSAALDDSQLAVAVEPVTAPVAGLGRRSIPIARAQLVAWAIAVHRAAPDRRLRDAIADRLTRSEPTVAPAAPLDSGLAPAPLEFDGSKDDLTDRLARLLERRPDLARAPREAGERAPSSRGRAVWEGVGHGR